jgi:SulP family sulfate permease
VILGLLAGVVAYWALALTVWPQWRTLNGNAHVIGALSAAPADLLAGMLSPWESLGRGSWPAVGQVLWPALTLAVLLSIDTLKTCVVLDAMTGTRHRSNRELIGQGLGNLASTLTGGIPGAGTMGATLVNKASGGTTALSGVFQGLWALVAVVVLTPLMAWVPVSSLAALLTVIGVRMIDWHSRHWLSSRSTRMDFVVIAVVVLVANTWSLIAASGLGVGLAILMFIREQIYSSTVRRKTHGHQRYSKRVRTPSERAVLQERGEQTVIFELQGSLFFGTTDQLYSALEPEIKRVHCMILDFQRVQSLDVTSEHMLRRVRDQLHERGGVVVLTRLPDRLASGRNLKAFIEEMGLVDQQSLWLMDDLNDALAWAEEGILAQAGLGDETLGLLPLRDFELLDSLNDSEVDQLASVVTRSRHGSGERILHHGEHGDALMLLALGEVSVHLPLSDGKSLHVATLGRGAHFAEMSFLDGRPYSADVRAVTDCEVLTLSRRMLETTLGHDPRLMGALMRSVALALADRLRQTNIELREMRES